MPRLVMYSVLQIDLQVQENTITDAKCKIQGHNCIKTVPIIFVSLNNGKFRNRTRQLAAETEWWR